MLLAKKGFTLIELLIVIAIIGLIASLSVAAVNNAKQKSRDARRLSDIKQVQSGLDMYLSDKGFYPNDPIGTPKPMLGRVGAKTLSNGNGWSDTISGAMYIGIVPADPLPTQNYNYTVSGSGNSWYTITFTLEGTSSGYPAGLRTATPKSVQ